MEDFETAMVPASRAKAGCTLRNPNRDLLIEAFKGHLVAVVGEETNAARVREMVLKQLSQINLAAVAIATNEETGEQFQVVADPDSVEVDTLEDGETFRVRFVCVPI